MKHSKFKLGNLMVKLFFPQRQSFQTIFQQGLIIFHLLMVVCALVETINGVRVSIDYNDLRLNN